ncbi:MAG: sigma 54-interacting transcriptional regulator, partial [Erysipelotrichaceae bacterium]
VYFWHTDIKRVVKEEYIDEVKESVFSDLIGVKGSLKNAVEQCKSAVFYPNKGMSILLTGPSGVGKSYIASLLHKYAIQKGRVN